LTQIFLSTSALILFSIINTLWHNFRKCVITNVELEFMLKFANVELEFLLEFGMRYPCLSLAIDKCCLLICCWIFFYEYESFFIAFVWQYTIYSIMWSICSILYIIYCAQCTIYYIKYIEFKYNVFHCI
jgi:hypothetical protein